MLMSQGARSAGVIGCPNLGASPASATLRPSASPVAKASISRIDMAHLALVIDPPAGDGVQCSIVNAATFGVPLGGPRSAMNASRLGCTLPASSVARLCKIAVPPSQFHGIRKRVNALLRTGACNAACAQLLPPSAETSTLLMRPFPEKEMPEIS